jgi:hypothetical protein
MNEKRIISLTTMFGSLCGYFISKAIEEDAVPIVMICGFFGSIAGEKAAKIINENNGDQNPPPSPT